MFSFFFCPSFCVQRRPDSSRTITEATRVCCRVVNIPPVLRQGAVWSLLASCFHTPPRVRGTPAWWTGAPPSCSVAFEFHTRSAPAALLLWQLSLNVLRVRVALFGETRARTFDWRRRLSGKGLRIFLPSSPWPSFSSIHCFHATRLHLN